LAKAEVAKKFSRDIRRMGHGLQRAFIVSVLQLLAKSKQEEAPTLLLGLKSGVYQHPPRQDTWQTSWRYGKCWSYTYDTQPLFCIGKELKYTIGTMERRWGLFKGFAVDIERLSSCIAAALGGNPRSLRVAWRPFSKLCNPRWMSFILVGWRYWWKELRCCFYINVYWTLRANAGIQTTWRTFYCVRWEDEYKQPLAIAKELSIHISSFRWWFW